jgi:hypothetical protein
MREHSAADDTRLDRLGSTMPQSPRLGACRYRHVPSSDPVQPDSPAISKCQKKPSDPTDCSVRQSSVHVAFHGGRPFSLCDLLHTRGLRVSTDYWPAPSSRRQGSVSAISVCGYRSRRRAGVIGGVSPGQPPPEMGPKAPRDTGCASTRPSVVGRCGGKEPKGVEKGHAFSERYLRFLLRGAGK